MSETPPETAREALLTFATTVRRYYELSTKTNDEEIEQFVVRRLHQLYDDTVKRPASQQRGYIMACTEEYAKLVKFHEQVGVVQPTFKNTGGRYLP